MISKSVSSRFDFLLLGCLPGTVGGEAERDIVKLNTAANVGGIATDADAVDSIGACSQSSAYRVNVAAVNVVVKGDRILLGIKLDSDLNVYPTAELRSGGKLNCLKLYVIPTGEIYGSLTVIGNGSTDA